MGVEKEERERRARRWLALAGWGRCCPSAGVRSADLRPLARAAQTQRLELSVGRPGHTPPLSAAASCSCRRASLCCRAHQGKREQPSLSRKAERVRALLCNSGASHSRCLPSSASAASALRTGRRTRPRPPPRTRAAPRPAGATRQPCAASSEAAHQVSWASLLEASAGQTKEGGGRLLVQEASAIWQARSGHDGCWRGAQARPQGLLQQQLAIHEESGPAAQPRDPVRRDRTALAAGAAAEARC